MRALYYSIILDWNHWTGLRCRIRRAATATAYTAPDTTGTRGLDRRVSERCPNTSQLTSH